LWSDELTRLFGVDQDNLLRIVNPWNVIGHVPEAAARECGLKAGTSIAAGYGDLSAIPEPESEAVSSD
jgi:xylulokinase